MLCAKTRNRKIYGGSKIYTGFLKHLVKYLKPIKLELHA